MVPRRTNFGERSEPAPDRGGKLQSVGATQSNVSPLVPMAIMIAIESPLAPMEVPLAPLRHFSPMPIFLVRTGGYRPMF